MKIGPENGMRWFLDSSISNIQQAAVL